MKTPASKYVKREGKTVIFAVKNQSFLLPECDDIQGANFMKRMLIIALDGMVNEITAAERSALLDRF